MIKSAFAGISAALILTAAALTPAHADGVFIPGAGVNSGPLWQGLYAGGHVGGAWGDISSTVNAGSAASGNYDFNTSGVFGGGQAGFNLQSGAAVFGVEADLGGLDMSGKKVSGANSASSSAGFYGDVTGRLGLAQGRALFYAKGGAAFFDSDLQKVVNNTTTTDNTTFWGWTAGAGAEYMSRANWSVKLEYQHFDFGDERVFKPATQTTGQKYNPVSEAVTLGVNYHLNSGGSPLK
jgi:outer membrane immunogenic protein